MNNLEVLDSKALFYERFKTGVRPPEFLLDSDDGYSIGRALRSYRSAGGRFFIIHTTTLGLYYLELFLLLHGMSGVLAYDEGNNVCGIYVRIL